VWGPPRRRGIERPDDTATARIQLPDGQRAPSGPQGRIVHWPDGRREFYEGTRGFEGLQRFVWPDAREEAREGARESRRVLGP
jgi:hypothetical protein